MPRRAAVIAAALALCAHAGAGPAVAAAPAPVGATAPAGATGAAGPTAHGPVQKPGERMTNTTQPRFTNRLAKEKSPYLLQHAHNPVDWYPWGAEAFDRAKRENKPIFLSIGYSTCHWCHVMERESFENEDIARVLNELFVCIKVDREERPDIDQIYMNAVMRLNGNGGWPMTLFLTPDRQPFYGGTYYPPEDRGGRPGLPRLAHTIADAWANKHEDVLNSARLLTEALGSEIQGAESSTVPGVDLLRTADAQLARAFDSAHGGFGGAPKFPRSHVLSLLLRVWKRTGDAGTLARVEKTLVEMDKGGIHDHLGGGFHRYSVDDRWLVPHFEKMLYDQAILARTYVEAYRATGKPAYAATARDIFEYVLRDLRAPEGGFYSAEDADSEGEEGKFYVWTPADLKKVLGDEDAALVSRIYGVTQSGNFEHGWSILHLDPDATPPSKEIEARLVKARAALLAERSKRKRPHLDDKVLADWNGLMIGALADGAAALGEPRYAVAAARAADFVLTSMRKDGRLLHTWRQGEAKVPGFLEDHAFLGNGLVDLYEATFDPRWLKEARTLADALGSFRDEAGGGWFLTGATHEKLLSRPKELYDGAVMSGNSMATLFLLRLGHLTASAPLEEQGRRTLASFGAEISARPTAYTQMLIALDFQLGPVQEIVIAGESGDAGTGALLGEVRKRFLPRSVVALRPSGPAGDAIAALVPYVKEQVARAGKPTAYVCEGYACKLPVSDPARLAALLDPAPAPPKSGKAEKTGE